MLLFYTERSLEINYKLKHYGMKKLFLTSVYLYLCVGLSNAQEVKPSEQAQGFTGFQNTSVNYCTGTHKLVHYNPRFAMGIVHFFLILVIAGQTDGFRQFLLPFTCMIFQAGNSNVIDP